MIDTPEGLEERMLVTVAAVGTSRIFQIQTMDVNKIKQSMT
jgi:hypothetical protein